MPNEEARREAARKAMERNKRWGKNVAKAATYNVRKASQVKKQVRKSVAKATSSTRAGIRSDARRVSGDVKKAADAVRRAMG